MKVFKYKIINNIKYERLDKTSCDVCAFNCINSYGFIECVNSDTDCYTYGVNTSWRISKSYTRKKKLEKLIGHD